MNKLKLNLGQLLSDFFFKKLDLPGDILHLRTGIFKVFLLGRNNRQLKFINQIWKFMYFHENFILKLFAAFCCFIAFFARRFFSASSVLARLRLVASRDVSRHDRHSDGPGGANTFVTFQPIELQMTATPQNDRNYLRILNFWF